MKKLLIGLTLLTSMSSFAGSDCTYSTSISERGEVERVVFESLKAKGYSESENGVLSITEVYTYDHGGDGFNGSTTRMKIKDNKTGLENVYFGNHNMFVLNASHVKSAKDLMKKIPSCK